VLLGRACFSILERQPFPLSFVTVSGAHLCGFPSEDPDFDLRGVHVTRPRRCSRRVDALDVLLREVRFG
jgi:predicted nucleotidyltransferase